MSVNEKMTAIADAIREKTGSMEALTLDQMATAIAGMQTGGGSGGSLESGEMTLSAHSWEFFISVSSKKTHVVVIRKDIAAAMNTPPAAKTNYFVYAEENVVQMQASIVTGNSGASSLATGSAYWYDPNIEGTYKTAFSATEIHVTCGYTFIPLGDYLWFAW